MNTKSKVLIVDDDEEVRVFTRDMLLDEYEVETAESCEDAYKIMHDHSIDVILLDIEFPKQKSGLDAMGTFYQLNENVQIIIISGFVHQHYIFAAGQQGAFDYLAKPLKAERIKEVIANALAYRKAKLEKVQEKRKKVMIYSRQSRFYISAKLILGEEFKLLCCTNLDYAKGILEKERADLLIFDYKDVEDDIEEFIIQIKKTNPEIRFMAITDISFERFKNSHIAIDGVIPPNAVAYDVLSEVGRVVHATKL